MVIRLELADQSPSPRGFQYSAGESRLSTRYSLVSVFGKLSRRFSLNCPIFFSRDAVVRCTLCTLPAVVRAALCLVSSVAEAMSDEELQEKSLGVAKHTLNGKSDLERVAILHQHIGSRAMGDMVIETFEPSPGELTHDVTLPVRCRKFSVWCKSFGF